MNNNITSIPKDGCSGCTACYSICPTSAINMARDDHGFKYPSINSNKCIQCGKCLKACPYNEETLNKPSDTVLAIKNKNSKTQYTSASGGFGAAVSETVIETGGYAFGTALTNDHKVLIIKVNNSADANLLKGSKYVQTDPCDTFSEAGKLLKDGYKVAFFGTSCHIDGLLHYLNISNISTANLITVDFLCHGVPSPQLFEEYCAYLSRKSPLKTYLCRTKANGWADGAQHYMPTIVYQNKEIVDTPLSRAWIDLFFSNTCLRPHCYKCPYATTHRRSADITMADFWGIINICPDFYDRNGVSLILTNTDKGTDFISSMNNIISQPCSIDNAVKMQGNYHHPSKKSEKYEQFWNDYKIHGFKYILTHYTRYNLKGKLKYIIKLAIQKSGINIGATDHVSANR